MTGTDWIIERGYTTWWPDSSGQRMLNVAGHFRRPWFDKKYADPGRVLRGES